MRRKTERSMGRVLRKTYAVAKYAAALLVALNLCRLPETAWLLPDFFASRRWLMGWVALLLALGLLADRPLRKRKPEDRPALLALIVPGLLVMDAAAIAHLYLSWYHSGAVSTAAQSPVLLLVMAAGCVLWIYGRAVPTLPFGSIWGLRTRQTLVSEEAWQKAHRQAERVFILLGALLLLVGTALL